MKKVFEIFVSLALCLCIVITTTVVDSVREPKELAIEAVLPSTEELVIWRPSQDGFGTREKRPVVKAQQMAVTVLQVRIRSPDTRCKSSFLMNLECFNARDHGKAFRLLSFG